LGLNPGLQCHHFGLFDLHSLLQTLLRWKLKQLNRCWGGSDFDLHHFE